MSELNLQQISGKQIVRISSKMLFVVRMLVIVAIGVSVYLVFAAFSSENTLAGCGAGSGCDQVLNSAWSSVLGVPVSIPAVIMYLIILSATFLVSEKSSVKSVILGWKILIPALTACFLGILWFVGVQIFVIKHYCTYCLIDHSCGLLIVILLMTNYMKRGGAGSGVKMSGIPWFGGLSFLGAVGVLGMIALQVAFKPIKYNVTSLDVVEEYVDAGRIISIRGGKYKLNLDKLPILGALNAKHVVTAIVEFQCPHCKKMNDFLKEALGLYGDQLTVIVMPMPLDSECNPHGGKFKGSCKLSKLAFAVGRADRSKYTKFHHWLFDTHPSPELAKQYAAKLIGKGKLEQIMASGWPDAMVQRSIEMYQEMGPRSVPKILVGSKVLTGDLGTAEALFEVLENSYGFEASGWDLE